MRPNTDRVDRPSASIPVDSLYTTAEKIYPRSVEGRFGQARVVAAIVLLGLFYGTAWLQIDGRQLLLFDLPGRQFHIFGMVFFPQDFVLLTLILICAALSLFVFTALAGRLWCGYACPQTVWTEVFLWIEAFIEGDRRARMKLDSGPMTPRKLTLKGTKHAVWIGFSLWTGFTFVGYFTPIRELGGQLFNLSFGPWEIFWILFYGFATYGNAGWMREQVCKYMCPYARFQGAMFDSDTLIISYDRDRGDPRGARRRGSDYRNLGLGDCIDCTLCVQVCPTGIDIREGLQYECIACAACVDVCDQVMDRMGYEPGLVRYTTLSALGGTATRVIRPRVLLYTAALIGLGVLIAATLLLRNPLQLDVLRDRQALYRNAGRGLIENVYTLRVINKDTRPHRFSLAVNQLSGAEIEHDEADLLVDAASVRSLGARVRVDPDRLISGNVEFEFELRSLTEPDVKVVTPSRFLGPTPRPEARK